MKSNVICVLSLGLLLTLAACATVDESEAGAVFSGQANINRAIASPSATGTSTLTSGQDYTFYPE